MSTSISSMLNSRMRVSGYASGLDVDSMVEKLMKVEKTRVDKVKQDKQVLEWQKDQYRDITSLLRGLKDKYFNITSSTNLLSASAFNKTAVAVSDPSVVSVTGNSTAGVSTHSITVGQIATVGASTGNKVTLDPTKVLMKDFAAKDASGYALTIDGKGYTYSDTDTISSFMARVNNDSGNNTYRFSYNTSTEKFVVTTKGTGENTVGASGSFIDSLNFTGVLDKNNNPVLNASGALTVTGEAATFTIDGITGYKSNTNTYTADGLTYNFLKSGTSNVSSTRDVEGMLKNIKDFVDAYNNIITTINTKTTEKRYRDYTPLTDDQKSSMKDSDIKLWEEKAKSGLLNNDGLLTGLGDALKKSVYDAITLSDGSKTSLSEIGISTTSYMDKGKLTIDETKLRTALTNNPDKVTEMFTKESTTVSSYNPDNTNTQRTDRYKENGALSRLDDILSDYVRTTRDIKGKKGFLLEKAGFTNDTTDAKNYMQELITQKEDLIDDLTEKLTEKEDYYYSRFTAMETAINNMNSQSSWLSQQLGSNSQG